MEQQPDASFDLVKLYELALQEYRFQVLLNWDRTKHALIYNGVMLGAAAGLYQMGLSGQPPKLVGALFLFVALNSILAILGSRKGHQYYRAARETKRELERRLKLPGHKLAILSSEVEAGWLTRIFREGGKVTIYTEALLAAIATAAGLGVVQIFFL